MAARAGVTRQQIIDAAIAWLDADPDHTIALGPVARAVGIRPQSIYAHVDGADGLARAVAIEGLALIEREVNAAAVGQQGTAAVEAIVRAHLELAGDRPALYLASLMPPGDDPELIDAVTAAGRPLEIVLAYLGLPADERVHWTRLFLSTITGFVQLRRRDRLSLPVAPDETAERLVTMLLNQLTSEPVTASAAARHR